MTLVSPNWVEKNLGKVKVVDASWHMPKTKRNAFNEYLKEHIPASVFFDLDKISEENHAIPHMMPALKKWEFSISNLGINNSDHLVIYDNSDVYSACRCWFSFIYFGHDPMKISILDGGFKKWKKQNRPTSNKAEKINKSNYVAKEIKKLIKSKEEIKNNILSENFELIDARSKKRFLGMEPEPRKELLSGNIKNSKNIPFIECINKSDNTFKNLEELKDIFNERGINYNKDLVFTCGSGVTACVLGLANSIISGKTPIIYDGSWAEWGKK